MKFLTSRRFLVGIGALALVALVWLVLGWWLHMDVVLCFLLTTVLLLAYVVYLLIDQRAMDKNSAAIERSIWQQSEEQKLAVHPSKRREVDELKSKLETVIGKLKRARGKSALSTIPWYLMIGPPAAGKTTAIRNSGLEFPFETDVKFQGVGGTRNCDWWFSSSAIILDTAGRYVEQDDREDWVGFLRALKKYRRRRPINGVVVGVSIADVLGGNPQELDTLARTLRKRIDELITELGVRFPVYLLFTKCDLIGGFVEFFEDFGRNQREQIWGYTFGRNELENPNPRVAFEREFRTLGSVLQEMRFRRLTPGLSREQRSRVYAFPLEFSHGRENLAYFAGKLFQPNPYQEGPLFRGFYFTSGTQEGVPIAKVVQEIARAFGLATPAEGQFAPEIQTKSYFFRDLFTDVMIPDSNLVHQTRREKRLVGRMQAGISVAAVLGIALFAGLVLQAYIRSSSVIEEAESAVLAALRSGSPADRDPLLSQITMLNEQRHFMFGLDRSGRLLEGVERLYFKRLRPGLEIMQKALENQLRNKGLPQNDLFYSVSAYLLMTTHTSQLATDPANQRVLIDVCSRLSPTGGGIGGRHLEFFASHYADALQEGLADTLIANKELVADALRRIGALDVPVVYQGLLRQVEQAHPQPMAWADARFKAAVQVRGAFTRDAQRTVEDLIERGEYRKFKETMQWMVGEQKQEATTAEERSATEKALRELYARDYAAAWWEFLENVTVRPPGDLPGVADDLRLLSHPTRSPIVGLLGFVRDHTDPVISAENRLEQAKEEGKQLAAKIRGEQPANLAALIGKEFNDLRKFVGEEGQPSDLQEVLKKYAELSEDLENLSRADFSAAVGFVEGAIKGTGRIAGLTRIVRDKTEASDMRTGQLLRRLLESPIHFGWRAGLARAGVAINERWSEEVFQAYGSMSEYFPFNPKGTNDVPAATVAKLFGDEGTLWSLMGELKELFLEKEKWTSKKWSFDAASLEITPGARTSLLQARAASRALFPGTSLTMTVNVKVEDVKSKDGTDVDLVTFHLGSQECKIDVDDPKGTRNGRLQLPAPDAAIQLVDLRPDVLGLVGDRIVGELQSSGDWAFFRLIKEATREAGPTPASVRFTWSIKNNFVVRCLLSAENATQDPFGVDLNFKFPSELVNGPR
jgi:type VI secretion system protein ImpL